MRDLSVSAHGVTSTTGEPEPEIALETPPQDKPGACALIAAACLSLLRQPPTPGDNVKAAPTDQNQKLTGHKASMNRTEFLQQPEVIGFTDWLAATLPSDGFS